MARPRQHSDDEILEVARKCFLRDGPSVSTTVIAAELDMSQAALFKRFGTKSALMIAALAPPEKAAWLDEVAGGPDERPIDVQLVEIAVRLDSFFAEIVPGLSVLKSSGIDMKELLSKFDVPPPVRGLQALATWFGAAVAQGRMRPCNPVSTALMFFGPLHSRAFMAHIIGPSLPVGDDSFLQDFVSVMWTGLAPEPQP